MAGMLEIPSARGGVTRCLPLSVDRSAVVIGTAAPGILVLAAREFPGAVPPTDVGDVYEEIVAVVSRHFASAFSRLLPPLPLLARRFLSLFGFRHE